MGTRTLMDGLGRFETSVNLVTPQVVTPVYTLTRILFNESLRRRNFRSAVTIGVDADGYSIAGKNHTIPHVACIKGVVGDVLPFERGATRASMAIQARFEAKHAQRADLVITVSRYCAERLEELYHVRNAVVVPELIDLESWRRLFRLNAAVPDRQKFTVLSVCRFYPRKRLEILLRAAAQLREFIPQLEVRIVGNGPEYGRLRQLCRTLNLAPVVRWLGDLPIGKLAEEYNRAHIFCLPSVQEGFGIVFLEAMAAGKPIVAARAAAIPEVVRNGILVEPDSADAVAEGIARLYCDPKLCRSLGLAGRQQVEEFEMTRVARQFLFEVARIAPHVQVPEARKSAGRVIEEAAGDIHPAVP